MSNVKWQINRQYELRVGNGNGTEIVIDNLHIEFTVTKSSDNKKRPNKANIRIYNLSEERQKYFESPFVEVVLSVGYVGLGMQKIFAGQVTVAGTQKQGADTVTEVQLDSLYTELNMKNITQTAPAGSTVKQVIEKVALGLNVVKTIFSGENIKKTLVDGYPLLGSPRQIMTQIADAFEIEWQIDDQILYIQDAGKSYMTDESKAYRISEESGLIERPYFDNIEKQRGKEDKIKKARRGVQLKILLNPAIVAGSIVYIDYGDFTGYYKVERLKHKGGIYTEDWETELYCGTMIK